MSRSKTFGASLLVAAAALAPSLASGATWLGGTSGDWNTAANWSGTAPDSITEQAIVYSGGANLTQNLNGSYLISGITVGTVGSAITINTGTGTNTLTIGSGGINMSAATQNLTINVSTTHSATQSFTVGSGRNLNFATNATTSTFNTGTVTTFTGGGTVTFSNQRSLAGAGNWVVDGVLLDNNLQGGTQTRSGTTTVKAGSMVRITTSVSLFGSGNLNIDGGLFGSGNANARTIANNLVIGGDFGVGGTVLGVSLSTGTINFNGNADLGSAVRTITVASGTSTTFQTGVVSGTGGITKAGAGTMNLLNANNSFSGNVSVTAGTLVASGSSSNTNTTLGSASGSRTITVGGTGLLRLDSTNIFGGASQTLANTPKVIVNSGGTFRTGSYNVVGNIDLNGGTINSTGGTGTTYQSFEFNGSTITVSTAASTISGSGTNSGMHLAGGKTLSLVVNDATSSSATDLTVSSVLIDGSGDRGGAGALSKSGSGTLLLSGANTYTGATSITAGIVMLGNAAGLGGTTGSTSVSSGAVLDLNGQTVGAEAVSLNGSGISSGGALINSTGTASLSGAVTLATSSSIGGAGNLTLSGGISGGASLVLTKVGAGSLTLNAAASFSGNVVVNAGTVVIGHQSALGAFQNNRPVSQVTVADGATVNFNGVVDATYGYTITGTGVGGNGALVNNGAAIGTGNAQTSNITLANNAAIGGSGNWAVLTNSYGATNVNLAGFTLTKLGANTISFANTTFTAGTVRISAGGLALTNSVSANNLGAVALVLDDVAGANFNQNSHNISLASLAGGGSTGGNYALGNATLTVGGSNASTAYAGAISGTGSIVKRGTGTLTLSSASSAYSGATTLSQGSLVATHASAFGSTSAITLGDGSTGSGNLALSLNATGGELLMARPVVVSSSGSGTATLGSATTAGTSIAAFTGGVTLNRATILDGGSSGDRLGFAGAGISGSGAITIAGTSRVVFNAASGNAHTGNVTINSGATLQLGDGSTNSSSLLSDTGTVAIAGTLSLAKNGNLEEVAGISGAGTITAVVGLETLRVGGDNSSSSFSGTMTQSGAGTLALSKVGSGTLTLSGSNGFTGGTTVANGTLELGHASNTLSDSGAVTISGGTLALGSNSDTIGALSVTSGGITGSGTLTTSGASFNHAGTVSVAAILAGGGLTKEGAGTLTLSAANTYTGATVVNAGTLNLGSGSSLASGSAVTVADGATLAGTGSAAGAVTVSSGGILSPGASNVGTLSVGSLTFGASGGDTATIQLPVTFGGNLVSAISVGGDVVANGGANSVTFAFGGNLALLPELASVDDYYTLLTYTGTQLADVSAFTYSGTVGARQILTMFNATGAIGLKVTNAFVIWSGDADTGWSTANNWKLSSTNAAVSYVTDDVVVFNDAASTGTIDLAASVQASTVTFKGDTLAYSIGSGNGSGITAASLAKEGAATVTLNTANTISAGVSVSAGTLVVGNAGALGTAPTQLTGGTLDLNGYAIANNIVLGGGTLAGDGATLSGAISETGGSRTLVVGSDLTLTGTNTYTGGTTISAGTLRVGAGGTAGTLGSGTVTNNGTLVFDRSDAQTVSNAITGSGAITKSANNTLTLSGESDFGGTFSIDAGRVILTANNNLTSAITVASGATLQVGNGSTAGFIGNSATISNSGALEWNRSNLTNVGSVISGSGTLTKLGGDILSLNANNSISGTVTISAGTLRLGGTTGTAGSVGSGEIVNNATLALNRSNTLTLGNLVSGTGALTQTGAGTSILTADNTYAGTTTISAGILQVGDGGTAGSLGQGAVTNNSALVFNRSDNITVGNAISGTGSLTKQGNGTLTLSVANSYSGGTTLSAGTVQLGNATALGSAAVTVASGATLNVAGFGATNALTISGSGSGANPALWNSTGTATTIGAVTLGANASVGNGSTDKNTTLNLGVTNLAGNTLTIASGAVSINIRNFSSGDILIANGGTLFTDNGTNTYATPTGTITINAGGRMETRDTDNTAQTSSHTIALNGGTLSTAILTNNNGGGAGTTLRNAITVDATNGGSIVGNNTAFALNLRLTGAITGSGSLAISGAQGVELRGDLSGYTGTATVSDGTLTFNPTSNTTFGGILAGSRPIVKSGSTSLTFGAAQSYTGTTTVSAGSLILSGAGDISSSSSVTLSASGAGLNIASASGGRTVTNLSGVTGTTVVLGSNALTVSSGANSTVSGVISGSAGLVKAGASQLSLAAANTFSGGVTLNAGTLDVQVASVVTSGSITSGGLGTGTLTVNGGTLTTQGLERTLANNILLNANLTVTGSAGTQGMRLDGVISGSFGFTKEGAGRVTVTASNTFTGDVVINGGILATSIVGLGSAGSVTINGPSDGGLAIAQNGITNINNLSGGVNGRIRSDFNLISGGDGARTLKVNQGVDGTYAGNIIQGGSTRVISLVKSGSAALTLSGTSSHTGGTTLSQGTLIVGNASALGTSGTVTINNADTGVVSTSLLLGSVTLARAITVANQGSGAVTLGSNGAVALPEFSGRITLNRSVVLDGSSNSDRLTFSGGIDGTGDVNIAGTGRVVFLTTANTYSGATNIAAGSILQVGAATSALDFIPDASVVTVGAGGFLKLGKGSNNETVGGLSGSGTVRAHEGIASAAASLTISNAASQSFSGVIEDGGASGSTLSLTKSGAGNQTLTGTNTYTGATLISGGILQVGNGGTTGTLGSGTVTNNAALVFNRSNALSVANDIGGAGSLTKQGAGTLTLTGNLSYTGATLVDAGTLALGAGTSLSSSSGLTINGTLDVSALETFTVASNQTLNGSGTVIGDVTIAGVHRPGNSPGKQTIDGNLTYSGGSAGVQWELITASSSSLQAGVAYDQIVVNGNLDFSSATALSLVFNGAGSDIDWTDAFWNSARSWLVYDVGGSTTSFGNLSLTDAVAYPLDGVMAVSNVQDSTNTALATIRADAGFYLGQVGHDVRLYYRPIPEPSTYGLILGGLTLAGAAIRRRRAGKNSK